MRNIELEQSNIPCIVPMKSDKAITKGNNDQVCSWVKVFELKRFALPFVLLSMS